LGLVGKATTERRASLRFAEADPHRDIAGGVIDRLQALWAACQARNEVPRTRPPCHELHRSRAPSRSGVFT
jgi:hypothetical protein